jgi:hypothetical protein
MPGNPRDLESELVAVLGRADRWLGRTTTPPSPPAPGSSLAGDDRATAPWYTSQAAVWALTSAVDHFHALRCLLIDSKVIHNSAPFTLLRAASETAATAVYLLAPPQRKERVFRRLNLRWGEARDTQNARDLTGETAATSLEQHKLRLRKMAEDAGLPEDKVRDVVARPVSFSAIVKLAGETCFGPSGDLAYALWMVNSGVAHGRPWAQLATIEKDELPSGGDSVMMRMNTSTAMLSQFAQLTGLIIDRGWRLLDQRSTNHLG